MALQDFSRGASRIAGIVALTAALAACSGLPAAPTQPTRYDLGLAALSAPQGKPAAPLTLAEVRAPGLPEGMTAMFYRLAYSDGQQLRSYQQARWSLPPAQLLEQRLRLRLGQERPVLSPQDNVSAAPGLLRVEVDEFSQTFDSAASSRAVLRLRASLIGGQLLGQQVFTAQVPAQTADAAGGARAMALAVDDVAAQIDRWLQGYGR